MDSRSGEWSAWLQRHGPALLLFARQWTSSAADADDLVQEAFVRFWKTRQTVTDPPAYLFACVKAAAMDQRRSSARRRRREQAAVPAPPEARPMLVSRPEADERRQQIEAALATLPAEQRQVIVLKVWGELTFAQIGQALAIPLNTAASRYRYGLAALRSQLGQEVTP